MSGTKAPPDEPVFVTGFGEFEERFSEDDDTLGTALGQTVVGIAA
ncbi:MAG: hypothetical protein ACR2PF_16065 [Rhizobiaceae bacterium]